MIRRLVLAALAACLILALTPDSAEAGRKVRLMYEPPQAAPALSTAVNVTFVDAREEKKGGKEPNLIAQERNNMGMPSGIHSGKQGTMDPPTLLPSWGVDVLKAAGYDARVGEDASLPTVQLTLRSLWGDGMPVMGVVRHKFWLHVDVAVLPAGGGEPTWTSTFAGDGGTTTVMMRFDDPFETGFVRAFDQAAKGFLAAIATDAFQAALPGGDLEAAATASSEQGVQKDASGERKVGSTGVTAEDLPKGFEGWDPEVYGWGGKDMPAGFVFGGVGIGLIIGGDQLARDTALNDVQRVASLPAVFSTLNSLNHLPYTSPDPGAGPVAKGVAGELMFQFGIHMTVPSLGATIPTLIAAGTGNDIQTVKAVMGIASMPSFLVPGITMLNRFRLFPPEFSKLQNQTEDAYLHMGAGIFNLAIGLVDVVVGGVTGVVGILYAADVIKASPTERGLMPVVGGRGGRLKNAEARMLILPFAAPTDDGGGTVGIVGIF